MLCPPQGGGSDFFRRGLSPTLQPERATPKEARRIVAMFRHGGYV